MRSQQQILNGCRHTLHRHHSLMLVIKADCGEARDDHHWRGRNPLARSSHIPIDPLDPIGLAQPIVLLKIGANVAGAVFVVATPHLLYVNTRLLPEHVRTELEIIPVASMDEVLSRALEQQCRPSKRALRSR